MPTESMDVNLFAVAMNILLWMWENPLQAWLLLFAEYVTLMELSAYMMSAKGEWFARFIPEPIKMGAWGFFLVQDWLVNWQMSIIFLDLPYKLDEVVTDRMIRYRLDYRYDSDNWLEKWRSGFANWLCRHLNRHDPTGFHC